MSDALTLDRLLEAALLLSRTKVCVGLVCRRDILDLVRGLHRGPPPPLTCPPLCGVDLYHKEGQVEPWRAFYDRDELRAYLGEDET